MEGNGDLGDGKMGLRPVQANQSVQSVCPVSNLQKSRQSIFLALASSLLSLPWHGTQRTWISLTIVVASHFVSCGHIRTSLEQDRS